MPSTFAEMAPRYDALRPLSDGDRKRLTMMLAAVSLEPEDLVVEVGCGTGRLALPLGALTPARVLGLDSEPRMLEVARAKDPSGRITWREATAYRLPLDREAASLVLMAMVVHLLKQRGRAFREVLRVLRPGGRLSVWTFTREHVVDFYLNRYFPSIARIDGARFPAPKLLERELRAAGFATVSIGVQPEEGQLALCEVVDRVRGRYISTLSLLPPREYRLGLQALEEQLARDPHDSLPYRHEWAILTATKSPR